MIAPDIDWSASALRESLEAEAAERRGDLNSACGWYANAAYSAARARRPELAEQMRAAVVRISKGEVC